MIALGDSHQGYQIRAIFDANPVEWRCYVLAYHPDKDEWVSWMYHKQTKGFANGAYGDKALPRFKERCHIEQ